MPEIRVEGAEKLGQVGARLKEIGDKGLKRELLAGLRRAAVPLAVKAQASAVAQLPRKGGLNRFVGAAKFSVATSMAQNPKVRITAKLPGHNLREINKGIVRHPVFGNREVWVTQKITPGWFTAPLTASAAPVRHELVSVIDAIRDKAEGR